MGQMTGNGQGFRRAVDTTRHHRENGWDCHGRAEEQLLPPPEFRADDAGGNGYIQTLRGLGAYGVIGD